MAAPLTILVVGANRGIGFQLTKRLLSLGHKVYGSYRPATKNDDSVKNLAGVGAKLVEIDVAEEASIKAASEKFGEAALDVLIHVAGVYNLWDDKLFTEHEADDLMLFFKVNVVGPFLTSKYFLPALSKSERGRIVNISSDMASIADNTGGNVCYRISKCGVNQLTKTQSMDLQKVAPSVKSLAVHPGYVATKMTNFYGEDDMEDCMNGLCDVVQRFSKADDDPILHSGAYVRWNGEAMDL